MISARGVSRRIAGMRLRRAVRACRRGSRAVWTGGRSVCVPSVGREWRTKMWGVSLWMPWVHELMAGTGRERISDRTYIVNHNGIGLWNGAG